MTPAEFIDNPNWAKCISELQPSPRSRHLPTHEDCSPLDIEHAAAHLSVGGTLGSMPGYEMRAGQIDMLKSIVNAFNHREHLMIEAGTGVGKSLAYLIPAILWANANDTTVVVSTATRNLQSQLISSDIPRALSVLGPNRDKFKVALLKGRANYLCLRAVDEFFSSGFWTMSDDEQAAMPEFINFLQTTQDGDLDAFETLPRSQFSCPTEECSTKRCPFYSRCFVYKARHRAANANLVVVNHALVLANATSIGGGILPPFARLIIDEAHNLEDITTEYLSREFSLPIFTKILNRLSKRQRRKHGAFGGVLSAIDRQLKRGILAHSPSEAKLNELLKSIPTLIIDAFNAVDELAEIAALLLSPAENRPTCRFRVENNVRQHSLNHLFADYSNSDWREDRLTNSKNRFEATLAALINLLHDIKELLENSAPEGEFNYVSDLAFQIDGIAASLVQFANDTDFIFKGEKSTHTYWVERIHDHKHPPYIRLVAAPLSIADDLKRLLYDVKDSVIFSSATLRVGNDFKYMRNRLGCTERFLALTATSPFDYFRQSLVLATDCFPDPSTDPAQYATNLAGIMRDLFTVTEGRALVLFTSYEMMNAVALIARDELESAGITLLVQGEGPSRETMTAQLKHGRRTVIFGAQSFWEGVDVAGEALSCVVLTRLPFLMVKDPIVEARSDEIDKNGGSSFRDYLLPEAVIKFRQGFGRLIRSKSDCGVAIITDPRLVTKNYGAVFKKSIPATIHTVTGINELLSRTEEFLA